MSLQAATSPKIKRPPSPWTNERVELLRQLWGSGSTREIAKKIGGVTAGAVLAKARRIGFRGPPRQCGTDGALAVNVKHRFLRSMPRNTDREPRYKPQRARDLFAPNSKPCTFMQLGFARCHFPLGSKIETLKFCNAPALRNPDHPGAFLSYCKFHRDLSYQPRGARL